MAYPQVNVNRWINHSLLKAWIAVINENKSNPVLASTAAAIAYIRHVEALQQNKNVIGLLFKKYTAQQTASALQCLHLKEKEGETTVFAFTCGNQFLAEWAASHPTETTVDTDNVRLIQVTIPESMKRKIAVSASDAKTLVNDASAFENFINNQSVFLPVISLVVNLLVHSVCADVTMSASAAATPKPPSSPLTLPSASIPTDQKSSVVDSIGAGASTATEAFTKAVSFAVPGHQGGEEEDEDSARHSKKNPKTATTNTSSLPSSAFARSSRPAAPRTKGAPQLRTVPQMFGRSSGDGGTRSGQRTEPQTEDERLHSFFLERMREAVDFPYIEVGSASEDEATAGASGQGRGQSSGAVDAAASAILQPFEALAGGAAAASGSSTNGPRPSSKSHASLGPDDFDDAEFDAFAGYDYDAANEAVVPVY